MRESASRVSTNARVMQQLPRHMRRRAASHNVKRLPRELRLAAEREVELNSAAGFLNALITQALTGHCTVYRHLYCSSQKWQIQGQIGPCPRQVWL